MSEVSAKAALAALFGSQGREDPYPYYAALRAHGPRFRLQRGRTFLSGYEACSEVLRDSRFRSRDVDSADANWPGWRDHPSVVAAYHSMLFANPPRHAELRKPFAKPFSPAALPDLAPVVEDALDRLARKASAGPVDFMAEFANPLPLSIAATALGLSLPDLDWWVPRVYAYSQAISHTPPGSNLGEADRATEEMLARVDHPDPHNLLLVLAAASDTTAGVLGSCLDLLARHPEHLARLRDDPDAAPGYAAEMLRYEPPLHYTTRVGEDGEVMVALLASANRDEHHCPNGDSFDPDRDQPPQLSFGAGPHYCLGATLARREIETVLSLLPQRFSRITPAGEGVRHEQRVLRGFVRLPLNLAE